ncbi:MAG: hypothetical protein IPN42_00345 [Methylococcaceae bacterium]|nr:hypothetical protein [Methylococcaceae bacterium]
MVACNTLKVGQSFPNYIALCKFLDEPIKKGGAKINQLKHWQTCFIWEKQKQKYIIVHIIKPLCRRPHLQRENSKWYREVAIILLNKIAETIANGNNNDGFNELVLTSIEAYMILGLCNGKLRNIKTEDFLPEIPEHIRIGFYNEATSVFRDILRNVLESLDRQLIITYEKTYRFSKENTKNTKVACFEEKTIIRKIIRELLDKKKLKNEQAVYLLHQEVSFYKELQQLLEENGFYNCYKVYRIGFTKSCLPSFQNYVNSLTEQDSARLNINSKVYNELKDEKFIGSIRFKSDSLENWLDGISRINKLIEITIPLLD